MQWRAFPKKQVKHWSLELSVIMSGAGGGRGDDSGSFKLSSLQAGWANSRRVLTALPAFGDSRNLAAEFALCARAACPGRIGGG